MPKCRVLLPLTIAAFLPLAGCTEITEVSPAAEAANVVRVQNDLTHGRQWQLGWGSVSIHDVAAEGARRTLALPGASQSGSRDSCPPDLLLSRTGVGFASSNAHPAIWRIVPDSLVVERLDIRVDADEGREFGFARLAWGPDERVMYAMSSPPGALWRIDLASATATRVQATATGMEACEAIQP